MIIKIIIGLLVLSFIVVIHELGHFLLAKKAGIGVEEFCVGLGPRVIYKKVGETIYSLRLFPIGGACMMSGEDDGTIVDDKSFNSKTVWQRISVVIAGPLFNFILAFVVSLLLVWFVGVDKPIVSQVENNSPAQVAGLRSGDKIVSINGSKILTMHEIKLKLFDNGNKPLKLGYLRDGENKEVNINFNSADKVPKLGIINTTGKEKVSFLSSFSYSLNEVKFWVDSVFVSLKKIFTGQVSTKEVSGPIGIVNMIGSSVEHSASIGIGKVFEAIGFFIILISANLGVMNLLPFPALDGGRLLFLIIELITRKRLNPKVEGYINAAGFVALMGLMVFLFYNDIVNLIR